MLMANSQADIVLVILYRLKNRGQAYRITDYDVNVRDDISDHVGSSIERTQ